MFTPLIGSINVLYTLLYTIYLIFYWFLKLNYPDL